MLELSDRNGELPATAAKFGELLGLAECAVRVGRVIVRCRTSPRFCHSWPPSPTENRKLASVTTPSLISDRRSSEYEVGVQLAKNLRP
jgi:hypothetical protein